MKNKLLMVSFLCGGLIATGAPSFSFAQSVPLPAQKQELESKLDLEMKNKIGQINQLKSQLRQKETELSDAKDELSDVKKQIAGQELLLQERDLLDAEIADLEKDLLEKEEALYSVRENMQFQKGNEEEVNRLMRKVQNLLSDYDAVKAENAEYKAQLEDHGLLEQELQMLKSEKSKIETNMQETQGKYTAAEEKLKILKEENVAALSQEISERDVVILDLKTQIATLEKSVQDSRDEFLMAQDRVQEERSVAQNLEMAEKDNIIVSLQKEIADLSVQASEAAQLKETLGNIPQTEDLKLQMAEQDSLVIDLNEKILLLERQLEERQLKLDEIALALQEKEQQALMHEGQKGQINSIISEMDVELEKISLRNEDLELKNRALNQKLDDMSMQMRKMALVQQQDSHALKPISALETAPDNASILQQGVASIDGVPTPMRKPQQAIGGGQNVSALDRTNVADNTDPIHGTRFDDFSPLARSNANHVNEAQAMEQEFMSVGAVSAASAEPQEILTDVPHDRPMPVRVGANNQLQPVDFVPELSDPVIPFAEPEVYYNPAVPIFGLLQAAEGYVSETFGLLKKVSGKNRLVYQWDDGPLYSSAEQQPLDKYTFDELARNYLGKTETRCEGDFAAMPVDTKDVGESRIDSYDIACIIEGEEVNAAASLVFFNYQGTFSAISYETATEYVDVAMDKREKLINTLAGSAFF